MAGLFLYWTNLRRRWPNGRSMELTSASIDQGSPSCIQGTHVVVKNNPGSHKGDEAPRRPVIREFVRDNRRRDDSLLLKQLSL